MINVEFELEKLREILNIERFSEQLKRELYLLAIDTQNKARILVPVRTGSLRRSIQATDVNTITEGLKVDVRANMPYAGFVEYGTEKMSPRPYLTPASEEAFEKFVGRVRDMLTSGGGA